MKLSRNVFKTSSSQQVAATHCALHEQQNLWCRWRKLMCFVSISKEQKHKREALLLTLLSLSLSLYLSLYPLFIGLNTPVTCIIREPAELLLLLNGGGAGMTLQGTAVEDSARTRAHSHERARYNTIKNECGNTTIRSCTHARA